jgi:hypothetical protein
LKKLHNLINFNLLFSSMRTSDLILVAQALEKIADAYHMNSFKLKATAARVSDGWNDVAACEEAVAFAKDLSPRALQKFAIFPENVSEGYGLVKSGEISIGYIGFLLMNSPSRH